MKKSVKNILFGVFFLAAAGFLAGIYLYMKPQKNLRFVKPDYVITAVDLQKEFEANDSIASAKYINKTLEVTGMILVFKVEEEKVRSIMIRTGNDISTVLCDLREGVDPEEVNTERPITIRGELSGFLMDILLNNCIIIK